MSPATRRSGRSTTAATIITKEKIAKKARKANNKESTALSLRVAAVKSEPESDPESKVGGVKLKCNKVKSEPNDIKDEPEEVSLEEIPALCSRNVRVKEKSKKTKSKAKKEHKLIFDPVVIKSDGEKFNLVSIPEFPDINLKVVKPGKHPYQCYKCYMGFRTKKAYDVHTPVHILRKQKRPPHRYHCNVCLKEFDKLCYLERHTRVHTGEKPWVCDICNNGFQQSYNLKKHLLTHVDLKPFQCRYCKKQFARPDVLTRHLLIHSKDKPFTCSVCQKSFIRQSQLNTHFNKHHPEEKFVKSEPTEDLPECEVIVNEDVKESVRTKSEVGDEEITRVEGFETVWAKKVNNKEARTLSPRGAAVKSKPECEVSEAKPKCKKIKSEHKLIFDPVVVKSDSGKFDLVSIPEFPDIKIEVVRLGKHPYQCHKCYMDFRTKKAYDAHTPIHILCKQKRFPNRFRCNVCLREFYKKCDLKRHTRVHTGEKPWVCDICNNRFQQSFNLKKHLHTHVDLKPFHCRYCKKQFKRVDVLTRHLLTHSKDKPFTCTICQKSFIRHSQLYSHFMKHHPEEKFVMSEPTKDLPEREVTFNLKKHLRTLVDLKPFQCRYCKKQFRTADVLTRHLLIHSKDKPFTCSICQNGFIRQSQLNTHFVKHHPEEKIVKSEPTEDLPECEVTFSLKKHLCRKCKKQFRRADVLTRHLLTHSKDKPFTCPNCQKGFIRHLQLDTHFKKHHPNENFVKSEPSEELPECEVIVNEDVKGSVRTKSEDDIMCSVY
ncbi:hypothetical protein JTB14_003009 [Gonioctena quinquepunctata]|nr:hypothetical protein JTB14_003009 [Gonioctena quinquepunctata]